MPQPTLSVLLSNYNHARFLPESLGAILAQSYGPKEVLIIDDASTDNSVEVIESFARQEPLIRLIRNERNKGVLHNAHRLLEIASGDYIYFAAADDRVLPNLFAKSMALLMQYPQAGLSCSDPATLDDRTRAISENRLFPSDRPVFFTPDQWCTLMRVKGAWIAGHTSVVKRTAVLEAGGMLPELRWHCDWFAYLVVGLRYGVCYIPEPLALIRVLPDSYSKQGTKNRAVQRQVLNEIARLLTSPVYQDVLPSFRQSGALAGFGWDMVRVLVKRPAYWRCLSVEFVRRLLLSPLTGTLAKSSPRLYHRLRAWYRGDRP